MSSMNVGFARREITPRESVPLAGYGNTSERMSQTILDSLYATCIAFANEDGERALLYTIDLISAGRTCESEIRPAISQATGIPVDHIHVSGTHTHAAPDTLNTQVESMGRYMEYLKAQMVQAAGDAIADLKPARLYMTRTNTKNLNFVRHYIMEDGTYAGPNFGKQDQAYIAHEGEPDTQMQLAKITREGGKDVVICNFGVHQTHTGGQKKYDVSADIAGVMRAQYEAARDCHFAYFTGACGNVVPSSNINAENVVPAKDHVAHGKALAQVALGIDSTYTEAAFGAIRTRTFKRGFAVNHTTDHLEEQAREVQQLFVSTNDRAAGNKLAREKYGFSSVYHAGAILRRKDMPATSEVTLDVLSVGDLAFALAPYEMFAANGIVIKEKSPFKMTMVLTLANRPSLGYLPTRKAFEYHSYEGDTCRFMPGIGENLAQTFVSMLKEMKSE